jgi:hypothetical protein
MPIRTRQIDDQTDYEDPIDRYQQRAERKKSGFINIHASSAITFGLLSLVPLLGVIFGPLSIVYGRRGLNYQRREPEAIGQGKVKSGIVLGSIGCFINYGLLLWILGLFIEFF